LNDFNMAGISDMKNLIENSSLLMVGAGGIGCELLKNLVLSGFKSINIIDLDTIDVSNLNRQFLFQRKHVGKSKAMIAKESALSFKPDSEITAIHDTIMNPDYNADYFSQFDIVLNALDNKAARNHVNRMCLAADVTLIESGTAGYLGQVTVIKKGFTECYECQPKPSQKTYPGCTIRNTPSEPVHCIVWAKHLFNQLFGECDADNEVSPDTEDPELSGEAGEMATKQQNNSVGNIERVSTRDWAKEIDFDAEKLFTKFFNNDIKYLLSMEKLWQKRKAPTPLLWEKLKSEELSVHEEAVIPDKRVWSIRECGEIFERSLSKLKERCKTNDEPLVWDKDDKIAMDFVAATANIRSYIFHIATKSRFDIKSISGNIIPAIATTNAIVAGLMVVEALKILSGKMNDCRTIYLNKQVKAKSRLLVPCKLEAPNQKCYVCAKKPEVTVYLDTNTFTVKQLEDKVFKEKFGMIAPDVEIDDGKGTILVSSEEGETEDNWEKKLSDFKIGNGSRLKGDDFLQNYELVVVVRHKEGIELSDLFLLEGELPLAPQEEEKPQNIDTEEEEVSSRKRKLDNGHSEEGGKSKKSKPGELMDVDREDSDDDIIFVTR